MVPETVTRQECVTTWSPTWSLPNAARNLREAYSIPAAEVTSWCYRTSIPVGQGLGATPLPDFRESHHPRTLEKEAGVWGYLEQRMLQRCIGGQPGVSGQEIWAAGLLGREAGGGQSVAWFCHGWRISGEGRRSPKVVDFDAA